MLEPLFALCELLAMAKLRDHLSETGETQRSFAARVRVSASHLNELLSGRKRPSIDLAFEIERATDGGVPVASWATADAVEPSSTPNNESSHVKPPEGCADDAA